MNIVSVSRRTDIPAFYAPWFMNRVRAGFAYSVNPYNPKQVRRIGLSSSEVACLVFWSKNPAPLLPHLDELDALGHRYYFQLTLTGLGGALEPHVPSVSETLAVMERLSAKVGPGRVLWRFDPICLAEEAQDAQLIATFDRLSRRLEGVTRRVTVSFLDLQAQVKKRLLKAGQGHLVDPALLAPQQTASRLGPLLAALKEMAAGRGMELAACAPKLDLTPFGVRSAPCIDGELMERLFSLKLGRSRDRYQRPACRCLPTVDLGSYGSCPHGCLYCYGSCDNALRRGRRHDPKNPWLLEPETRNEPDQRELWSDPS